MEKPAAGGTFFGVGHLSKNSPLFLGSKTGGFLLKNTTVAFTRIVLGFDVQKMVQNPSVLIDAPPRTPYWSSFTLKSWERYPTPSHRGWIKTETINLLYVRMLKLLAKIPIRYTGPQG